MSTSHRVVPPPPPRPPPPVIDRTGVSLSDSGVSDVAQTKPRSSPQRGNTNIRNGNTSNAHQKRSPGATRSHTAGTRVPPPPPPLPRKIPPPPPRRTVHNSSSSTAQQTKRRPLHPPPPPPPRMFLDSSEELASKAREMLHKCLKQSIPTGNLYSGGLGAYYLLLEQSRYHLMLLELQQNQQPNKHHHQHHHSSSAAPLRCKKLLKQALEGAKSATDRFKRSNSSNLSNQRSNISLLGGEWIGSHALLAVCYRRLEDFANRQQESGADHAVRTPNKLRQNQREFDSENSVTSPAGSTLFSKRISSGSSVVSAGGASLVSNATFATTNPRPRSQRVVDKILHRLEKQHRASTEDDDNLTYYTLNSNYTSNTLSSMVVATVWNQDVMGGRAGALQAIWWLRNEFADPTLGQELVVSMAIKILIEGLSTAASMGLNQHEKPEIDDDSTRISNAESCYSYCESDILFWVCDSQGSHRAYLGASRGVVGILHTLLGLSDTDWKLVEEQTPNARGCVRNTIDAFLSGSQSSSKDQEDAPLHSFRDRFLYETSNGFGNLRPRLDASEESDTTVDWFHGATGLAMLFLEASKVFSCKEYLQEAHRLCDVVIFPRGLVEQQKKSQGGNASYRSAIHKKGPAGLAGMAFCFLQLSRLCSDVKPSNEPNHEHTNRISLRDVWKTRAALYAKHAHQEWVKYLKVIPTTNTTGNAYSLYEGMGGVISLFWQLSLSTYPTAESKALQEHLVVQMPLYGLGFDDSSGDAISEETEPIVLSHGDVALSETSLEQLRAKSPRKSPRRITPAPIPSLAEARKRRAAAEAEAQKRQAQAEEARRIKEEQDRAVRNAERKAELEARKKAQLLARKKALEFARQREEEESRNQAKKEAEEKSKREALLLARKQAKERVEARRKEKEAGELAKARVEAQRKATEAENKRRLAEEEKKKRIALAEARVRRQKKEAQAAKQRDEERKTKEEADRQRRADELKAKEQQRKKRLVELRLRQQRAAEIAKEKEQQRLLQEEADRQRREMELKTKQEERKKQDAERKRRLAIVRERKKKQEDMLAQKSASEQEEHKLAARKALEKRRLQLQEQRLKKKKELEDKRLRKQLQEVLDNEAEKQRLEDQLQQKAAEELKMQEAMNAINTINQFDSNPVYSPSFGERKKTVNPAHFSAQTRSSLFWSLQTDSNIGSSENYKPALVAADSTPSSAAMSTTLDEPA